MYRAALFSDFNWFCECGEENFVSPVEEETTSDSAEVKEALGLEPWEDIPDETLVAIDALSIYSVPRTALCSKCLAESVLVMRVKRSE